ncbi:copper chaperone for superoxide dismutase-like [Anthonomus grandis grandis]|uniref:copper chaperone for superoxide dismutase-like n=1 Tax=Anthonomus grandis grandis TaxID=2921223 RepID=UPI0021663C33|nr:copper chaperone for superoxide dismutase-like [Anthonomus grandis grandis]
MTSTKIEFLVQMTCESCVNAVKNSLNGVPEVKSVEVDLSKGSVVVESTLPTLEIQKRLETTGKPVAIKGYEGSVAAVSILEAGNEKVKGVVRFVQATPTTCIIDGTIDGLNPGNHSIEVHECGNLSEGCNSVGKIYCPEGWNNTEKKYGKLGEVVAERNGRAEFRMENNVLKLSDVIGRSFVVSSQLDGCYTPVSCGIIARSAGLFQNPKTICACDGTTIWDEVSKPNSKSSL